MILIITTLIIFVLLMKFLGNIEYLVILRFDAVIGALLLLFASYCIASIVIHAFPWWSI